MRQRLFVLSARLAAAALVGCACAPAPARAAADDIEYVRPLLKVLKDWPREVTITSTAEVKASDPVTREPVPGMIAAGSTLPLVGVPDPDASKLQVNVSYEYSARRVASFTPSAKLFSMQSPTTNYKDETVKVTTPVPIEQTDLPQRIIAALKYPPTLTLASKVDFPLILKGKQVGTQPVQAGKVLTVVAFVEGRDKVDVDLKGDRATIPLAATDWTSGMTELRRRQGVAPAAPKPAPTPALVASADATPAASPMTTAPAPATPPASPAQKPVAPAPDAVAKAAETAAATASPGPKPVTPAPEVAVKAPPEKAPGTAPAVAASAPGPSRPSTGESVQPQKSTPADASGAGFSLRPAKTGFTSRSQMLVWTLAIVGLLVAVLVAVGLNVSRHRHRAPVETAPAFAEEIPSAQEEPPAGAVEADDPFRRVAVTVRDTEARTTRTEGGDEEALPFAETVLGLRPGQRLFGRYALKQILGRGGMGVVWEAFDESLEQEIALKFLPEVVRLDPVALDDLKRETRRCLKLTHPNIVRIHDFVSDDEAAAIAMELIDGATLAKMLVKRPQRIFEARELGDWVGQLCEALAYAHADARVIHRDLKPANLMLTSKGRLKVTDFGVARSVSDSASRASMQSNSSGTPPYMSPQQAMGEHPAITDDIYSVGATLYDLLTGRPPFYSGVFLPQILNKLPPSIAQRRGEFDVSGEEVPPEWEETVAACLAKEPAERPQSASDLAARLALAA